MRVAIPNKDIKPTISVIVVNITPPARAGSIFNLAKIKGRLTPLIAPMIRLINKADAITIPRKHSQTKNKQRAQRSLTIANHSIHQWMPL